MKTKEQKLAQVDELIKCLDIPHEEVIKHWQTASMTNAPANEVFTKTDYPNIKPGMFWYEDDTFSFDKIKGKKIKAIVELVEDGFVYGDLTASELFEIEERYLGWCSAMWYINAFSYPCQKNEKIVLYSIKQFENLCATYTYVRRTFDQIHKRCRKDWYWSSTECYPKFAWGLYFSSGIRNDHDKHSYLYVRPVLALKIS